MGLQSTDSRMMPSERETMGNEHQLDALKHRHDAI